MKVLLLYRDKNFNAELPLPVNETQLMQDLELEILITAMSKSDKFIYNVVKNVLLQSLVDADTILYRQNILKDALANTEKVRELYAIAVEAIEAKQKNWFGIYVSSPGSILYSAARLMEMYLPILDRLAVHARACKSSFTSDGFSRFFSMIEHELDNAYFEEIQKHFIALKFRDGVLVSAKLAAGSEATEHVLRLAVKKPASLLKRFLRTRKKSFSFSVSPRDEPGCQALDELRNRGLNCAANALARAADHIDGFFKVLRAELAFYIGCLNVYEQLRQLQEPLCFPKVFDLGSFNNEFTGLYNICLSLHMRKKTVGNDLHASGSNPVIITGVNEGGKSTFLRSIGMAQLMMQCGMFVPAQSFSAGIVSGIFTHYRRKEDRTMSSGKFDEELVRMSSIVEQIKPHALILFNEPFASTNEREGSDIAEQIIRALVEQGVRVVFVTHLYTFAYSVSRPEWISKLMPAVNSKEISPLFLKAERLKDGARTFRLIPGDPLPKSHGEDLYYKVFGED